MKELRVLLTSVGGLVAPRIIQTLRKSAKEDDKRIFIVGTDMRKDVVGFYFVDKSYVVHPGTSEGYIQKIHEICKDENINIIIPASDEELLAISMEREKFVKQGTIPICSNSVSYTHLTLPTKA